MWFMMLRSNRRSECRNGFRQTAQAGEVRVIDDASVAVTARNNASYSKIHDLPGLLRFPDFPRRSSRRTDVALTCSQRAYQNWHDVLAIRVIDVGGDTRCVLGISHFGLDLQPLRA
jgi:hypothetical protein